MTPNKENTQDAVGASGGSSSPVLGWWIKESFLKEEALWIIVKGFGIWVNPDSEVEGESMELHASLSEGESSRVKSEAKARWRTSDGGLSCLDSCHLQAFLSLPTMTGLSWFCWGFLFVLLFLFICLFVCGTALTSWDLRSTQRTNGEFSTQVRPRNLKCHSFALGPSLTTKLAYDSFFSVN